MLNNAVYCLILFLILIGCSKENYGGSIDTSAPTVQVKEVFLDHSLVGKKVNLKGVIVTQCQSSGCWFFLNDGTGQVFINLAPKNFTLPPKTGKKAKVTGIVSEVQKNRFIIAEAVEIGG